MANCTEHMYCEHLNDLIQDYHSKGIVEIIVTSTTGETKHLGLAYKKTPKDRGIMLNYCPFCGEKILTIKDRASCAPEAV